MTTTEYCNKLISENTIVVFGFPECGYCNKLVTLFEELSKSDIDKDIKDSLKNYKYINIKAVENHPREEFRNYFKQVTDATSVPRIFINGKCIGGYSDFSLALENKNLKKFFN